MTIAMAGSGQRAGVSVAEVTLKFIWDVVSQIKIGKAGHAFVLDDQGVLIAHPDISLVLQKTTFAGLDEVWAALAGGPSRGWPREQVSIARDPKGRSVMTAYATITPLRWSVFVEQPLGEAFETLYASIQRTIGLLALGVLLAVAASLLLARRMVTPIQALQAGAARIGAGELDQRIDVRTGDEVEALADQFNSMAAQLKESYAGLERKVEARTRELTESLEQQTAMGEILRVISSSPTDIQPVLDAVAENAARLCDAEDVVIQRVEGDVLEPAAHFGSMPVTSDALTMPISSDWGVGRAVLERRTLHIHDMLEEHTRGNYLGSLELRRRIGYRTVLIAPLLREGLAIGVIVMRRMEVKPFTDKQIALLQTFADQAVIAIENVRLFQELQARTRELARSVDELKALGEVGRAVSSTLDLETVLNTIVSRASQLAGADGCTIYEYDRDAEEFRMRAAHNYDADFVAVIRAVPLRKGEGVMGLAVQMREPTQIPDIAVPGAYQSRLRDVLIGAGYRAVLSVPLVREDEIIGSLSLTRKLPGEFAT